MSKAVVVVEGNIQGVGFRAYAKQLAKKFGLKGLAENLDDCRVKLFLDGEENSIKKFVESIGRKKGDAENPLALHVEKTSVFFEGEKGFEEAWAPYKGFEIVYGEELTPFEKESLERLELGSLLLQDFRSETGAGFNAMDKKYGAISEEMRDFKQILRELVATLRDDREEMKAMSKAFVNLAEKFAAK